MNYLGFARKYRPKTFKDLIGQEVIAQTLQQAVAAGRRASVYVFSGLHGVGKTSAARILAKALNCPSVKDGEPCGSCRICKSIALGSCTDVLEFDAASNSSVEDVRVLRESFAYSPAECPTKVFIIDECHRLSTAAFDALLHVFEEAVHSTCFILATTELHKLPATILSRSQTFRFRPATIADVTRALVRVRRAEKLRITKQAIRAVAVKAGGSLRDAQKYLEQVVAFTGARRIVVADVARLFGDAEPETLKKCLAGFVARDAGAVLTAINEHVCDGGRPEVLAQSVMDAFRGALFFRASGGQEASIEDLHTSSDDVALIATAFELEDVLRIMASLQEMQTKLRVVRDVRILVELTFAQIALGGYSGTVAVQAPACIAPAKVEYEYPAEFLRDA